MLTSHRHRQQHRQVIGKMSICHHFRMHIDDVTRAEEEIERLPRMAGREGLVMRRAHEAEIAVLDEGIQFLAAAEIIEVAADDGALAVLHQCRDFLKLLLTHRGVERVVPDEKRELVFDVHVVEELLRAVPELPDGAGEAVEGKDSVAVVAEEGEAPQHRGIAVLGIDMLAVVRREGLQEHRVVMHLEYAADIGLYGLDQALEFFPHPRLHPFGGMHVAPRIQQILPPRAV